MHSSNDPSEYTTRSEYGNEEAELDCEYVAPNTKRRFEAAVDDGWFIRDHRLTEDLKLTKKGLETFRAITEITYERFLEMYWPEFHTYMKSNYSANRAQDPEPSVAWRCLRERFHDPRYGDRIPQLIGQFYKWKMLNGYYDQNDFIISKSVNVE